MIDLSIIIPVYHEESNILKLFPLIEKKIKTPHEIIVIYDSKDDPTVEVVDKYLKKTRRKDIFLVKNSIGSKKGVINAIKTGVIKSKGKAIVIMMADLSDDIAKVDKMVKLIDEGADIVCASRYMKGGKKIGGPFFKTLLSRTAGLSLRYFFKISTHDATNAFKMYRRNIFNNIKIESEGGFEYSLEIIVKAHKQGYKIVEIPAVWRDREAGKSNFKLFKWLPKYIRWYLYVFKK